MLSHRSLAFSGLLALGLAAGCAPGATSSLVVSKPTPGAASSVPVSTAALTAEEQEVLDLLGFNSKASFSGIAPATPASYRVAARREALAAKAIEVQSVDAFYTGPFPQPGELAADYRHRPVGGFVSVNPKIITDCETVITETYWTPGGDISLPAAYTRTVERQGALSYDLYASPPQKPVQLPAFFAQMLSLPQNHTAEQTEETYRQITDGAFKGKAQGYRWSVFDAAGTLSAWIRAYQIVSPEGAKIDRYVLFSDYQVVKGERKPTRYAYTTYHEDTRVGLAYDQAQDPQTGTWNGQGVWKDLATGKQVRFVERITPGGQASRVYTYEDGERTLITEESYKLDYSGTGTVKLNGLVRANLNWDTHGRGSLTFAKGASRPYQATRRPPGLAKPPCSPAPAARPSPKGSGG